MAFAQCSDIFQTEQAAFPVSEAIEFAIVAHGSQKYETFPYIYHLRAVAQVLFESGYGGEPQLLAAAYLHDILEDTPIGQKTLKDKFGEELAETVWRLSDEKGETRESRKKATYPKIRGHRAATIVKLCDRIANMEFSADRSQAKYLRYLQEYKEFRDALFIPGMADDLWKRLDKLNN